MDICCVYSLCILRSRFFCFSSMYIIYKTFILYYIYLYTSNVEKFVAVRTHNANITRIKHRMPLLFIYTHIRRANNI